MYNVTLNYPQLGSATILGTFVKGKKPKLPEDYRILFEDSNNELYILWADFSTKNTVLGARLEYTKVTRINSTQLKQQQYNYYLVQEDPLTILHSMINSFAATNPLVPETLTSYMQVPLNTINYPIFY